MILISPRKNVYTIPGSFTLNSETPSSGSTNLESGIPLTVTFTFSNELKESTLTTSNFVFDPVLTGTFSIPDTENPNICQFVSNENLDAGTTYNCTVTTDVQDINNTPLGQEYNLDWTTTSSSDGLTFWWRTDNNN